MLVVAGVIAYVMTLASPYFYVWARVATPPYNPLFLALSVVSICFIMASLLMTIRTRRAKEHAMVL